MEAQRMAWNRTGVRPLLIGLLATVTLMTQPVDGLADWNLTIHMFQHLGIFVFSAVFGFGLERVLTSNLVKVRKMSARFFTLYQTVTRLNVRTKGLVFALFIPAIVFTYWHFPPNFDLAAVNEGAHTMEHLLYIVSGSLVGLSVVAVPRKLRIVLLYLGFMQAGMMGSMMLTWPAGFYTVYSAVQNTQMNAALMLFGAAGVTVTSAFVLKTLDVI